MPLVAVYGIPHGTVALVEDVIVVSALQGMSVHCFVTANATPVAIKAISITIPNINTNLRIFSPSLGFIDSIFMGSAEIRRNPSNA
jgi:hypothetical protein